MTDQERTRALAHYEYMMATVPAHQLAACPPDCFFLVEQNGAPVSLPVFGHPDTGQLYLVLPPKYAIFGTLVVKVRGPNSRTVIAQYEMTESGLQVLEAGR